MKMAQQQVVVVRSYSGDVRVAKETQEEAAAEVCGGQETQAVPVAYATDAEDAHAGDGEEVVGGTGKET